MKKWIALILVCVLCMGTAALAAEWAEGLSPAKPSNLKPEVDLTKSVGYWLFYPRTGLTADNFCDVLEIYLPNPDIALNEGTVTLWNADGEVCVMDVKDPQQAELRDLEESELEATHWGSGKCLEIHLPISLKFDENYYVTMDEGILTSNGGKVKSMPIPYSDKVEITEQYWTPAVSGDYGISGLYYTAPAATAEEGIVEEGEAAEEEAAAPAPKYNPGKGDAISFDVVLGGDAKYAVMNSENGSVYFETLEYAETGHVDGTITGDDMNWGVVFLDENGEVLDYISFISAAEEAAAE